MMIADARVSPVRIFSKTGKKLPSSRGTKQRFIIESLTLQKNMTRTTLAKLFAEKFMVPESHAYHYVFKELHECLIPNGMVEEAGKIKPLRGSRILQSCGIPCYRLTEIGSMLAMSLDDLDIEKRKELLKGYLFTTKILNAHKFALCEKMLAQLEKSPEKTLEIVKNGVHQFINGKITNPFEIIQNNGQIDNGDSTDAFYNFEISESVLRH